MTKPRPTIGWCLATGLIALLTAGCSQAPIGGTTRVWIDVPVDGLRVEPGEPVHIEGHAAGMAGNVRVQILVNGSTVGAVDTTVVEGAVAPFQFTWSPDGAGEYLLTVVAQAADGSEGGTDAVHVFVLESSTPTPTPTPPPTPIPTPTIPPGAEVEFWVDPPEIAAGGCARLNWRVRNASRVRLGSTDVAAEDSYEFCLCKAEAYTLTVTNLDGTEQQRRVTIQVNGECAAPTPPPDKLAPAAPVLVVPSDGLSIACKASQNLVWLPVDDPSGIAEYHLQVQRHSGDNNWQDIPGSAFTGLHDKQRSISVECGWYYRWRVRAVDGAGNTGPWSGWWDFIITLS